MEDVTFQNLMHGQFLAVDSVDVDIMPNNPDSDKTLIFVYGSCKRVQRDGDVGMLFVIVLRLAWGPGRWRTTSGLEFIIDFVSLVLIKSIRRVAGHPCEYFGCQSR